jgi:hypothetical protein
MPSAAKAVQQLPDQTVAGADDVGRPEDERLAVRAEQLTLGAEFRQEVAVGHAAGLPIARHAQAAEEHHPPDVRLGRRADDAGRTRDVHRIVGGAALLVADHGEVDHGPRARQSAHEGRPFQRRHHHRPSAGLLYGPGGRSGAHDTGGFPAAAGGGGRHVTPHEPVGAGDRQPLGHGKG